MSSGRRGGVQSEINVTPLIDVLLVLLIIFLVVMPIMMKKEAIEVPPQLTDGQYADPPFTVTVKVTGDIVLNDGDKDLSIPASDLARTLRPKLEAMHLSADKVVFVDFEDAVPWAGVMGTMDQIRSLAEDIDHDGIKVALKVKEQLHGELR